MRLLILTGGFILSHSRRAAVIHQGADPAFTST